MIPELLVGTALACVVGVPLALIGVAFSRRDTGTRCAYRRPHPAVILALDLRDGLRSGTAILPPAPCAPATWETIRDGMRPARPWALTDDDIRAQWEQARVRSPFLLPLRPCCPTTAAEAHRDGCRGRRPVNGRYLGTMPRAATADRAPFTAVDMPALREPEPAGLPRLGPSRLLPAERIPPQIAAFFDEQAGGRELAYGQAPVAEVLAAQRRYVLALGPDGCEQTP